MFLDELPTGDGFALVSQLGGADEDYRGMALYLDATRSLTFVVDNAVVDVGASMPAYSWADLAVTWDGQVVQLWVNGQSSAAVTAKYAPGTVGLPVILGRYALKSEAGRLGGRIDEVRIYNRALPRAELLALLPAPGTGCTDPLHCKKLYCAHNGDCIQDTLECSLACEDLSPGPIATWDMDGLVVDGLLDNSGQGSTLHASGAGVGVDTSYPLRGASPSYLVFDRELSTAELDARYLAHRP